MFGQQVIFVSPYQQLTQAQQALSFDDDYQRFCSLVGMDSYRQMVEQAIRKLADKPFVAIGESVGATALWRCTELEIMNNCQMAMCLYGSRVRDYLDIAVTCPVKLAFSADERYFLNEDTIERLQRSGLVDVSVSPLPHGYASAGHESFDESAFNRVMDGIKHLTDFVSVR